MANCRGCGKRIEFITLKSGSKMPVDVAVLQYDEVPVGTILITDQGNMYTKEKGRSLPNVKGRESHFGSCPKAKQFRKPKPKPRDDTNWQGKCEVCGQSPTVNGTDLCGPCCTGEADTIHGD